MRYKQLCTTSFSLIEIIVVLFIISIITAIAMPIFANYFIRSKTATMLSIATTAKLAVASEYYDKGIYNDFSDITYASGSEPFVDSDLAYIDSITITDGYIVITGNSAKLGNNNIILCLSPSLTNNEVSWSCSADSQFHGLIPVVCRNDLDSNCP